MIHYLNISILKHLRALDSYQYGDRDWTIGKVLKAVTVHQTSFKRLYEESMKFLLDPNHDIDLQGNLKVLEQKMEIIMELDRKLLDLMLEDKTPAEYVDAETSRADEILGKGTKVLE
ncbi:hypothetical protein JTB14_012859 [Gonioctena quinquepunctata]|nr:hypothetical protein JTB14_012859 [Gonioctena quinquepunctata]